jgi:short-subunit dehydrogenase
MEDFMKVTFITGAASGLGKEFAVLYGNDGNNLLLVDINLEALECVKNELSKLYPNIFIDTLVADLAKEDELKRVYAYTLEKGYFVNNVVNAAGFGDRCDFKDMDIDKQLKMTYVDCNAVLYFSKVFFNEPLAFATLGVIFGLIFCTLFVCPFLFLSLEASFSVTV